MRSAKSPLTVRSAPRPDMWPSPADRPVIALVVPCYNEEVVFPHTLRELSAYLAKLSDRAPSRKKAIYALSTTEAATEHGF
jgi:hypothetical protein